MYMILIISWIKYASIGVFVHYILNMYHLLAIDSKPYVLVPVLSAKTAYLPGSVTPEHYHAVYHMVFVLEGRCMLEKGDGRRVMRRGDIVIIDPMEKHVFRGGREVLRNFAFNFYVVPWERAQQHLKNFHEAAASPLAVFEENALTAPFSDIFGVVLRDTYAEYVRSDWPDILERIRVFREEIAWYFDAVHEGTRQSGTARHVGSCTRFLEDILGFLLASPEQRQVVRGTAGASDDITSTIIKYLKENIHAKLDLSRLAGHTGYTTPYLCNRFKKTTGTTIGSYFSRLRIRRACELLHHTSRPVSGIALDLGYSSSQHFDRVFRKEKGMTPRAFRRNAEAV
ncbi:MAG: helix-turn-helix domain-containing protein [Chitinivibrionales bacterium]|nr:helix-turn-helix domain-containing protein [Chitinivibrionales bacterium]MBD3395527.1 helix-turn-helix domain-containing protein [Chitinivibrionales bacterium]